MGDVARLVGIVVDPGRDREAVGEPAELDKPEAKRQVEPRPEKQDNDDRDVVSGPGRDAEAPDEVDEEVNAVGERTKEGRHRARSLYERALRSDAVTITAGRSKGTGRERAAGLRSGRQAPPMASAPVGSGTVATPESGPLIVKGGSDSSQPSANIGGGVDPRKHEGALSLRSRAEYLRAQAPNTEGFPFFHSSETEPAGSSTGRSRSEASCRARLRSRDASAEAAT